MPEEQTQESTNDAQNEGETTEQEAENTAEGIESLPQWAQDELRNIRKEAANYRTKLRELEPLKEEADARAEAEKTELQKTLEALEATRSELSTIKAESLRASVAAEKGLTPEQARRLQGSTKEELEADADELLSAFGGATLPGRPKERLRGGSNPSEDPVELDPAKLAAAVRPTTF